MDQKRRFTLEGTDPRSGIDPGDVIAGWILYAVVVLALLLFSAIAAGGARSPDRGLAQDDCGRESCSMAPVARRSTGGGD